MDKLHVTLSYNSLGSETYKMVIFFHFWKIYLLLLLYFYNNNNIIII